MAYYFLVNVAFAGCPLNSNQKNAKKKTNFLVKNKKKKKMKKMSQKMPKKSAKKQTNIKTKLKIN